MATEEKSREERRKEGRKDAGVSAFWQTNASIPGGSSTESVSVSLFLFRSSPTLPLRAPRASQPLSSSFSFAPARSPRLITLHGPPPEPPFALFSPPRTAAHHLLPHPHPPFLAPFPRAASSRPSRRYYALAPARQRQITLHFQSPKELQRPTPPLSRSPLCHLRPRSSSTSFHETHLLRRPTILTPLSSSLPRPPSLPPPAPPRPSPPASETPLCRASNGCSTPTHSGKASCPRTTSRLLQPPANFRALSLLRLRLLLSPPPAAERACWLRVIIVDKLGMTSPGTSKLSIPVK